MAHYSKGNIKIIMNKKDFVKIISQATDSNLQDAEVAFDSMTTAMRDSLTNDEIVYITDVGSLSTFTRKARSYHLPGGQIVKKGDRRDVRFKDFSELKEALNS